MKKVLLFVVAFAFAVTAWATDDVKVKVKENAKTGEVKVKAVEKTDGAKEVVKIDQKGTTVKGTDVGTWKKGDLIKEKVKFEKYEANGDYIYVVRDDKLLRIKHKLPNEKKLKVMKFKKGEEITVTSTYPLTATDVAEITDVHFGEK